MFHKKVRDCVCSLIDLIISGLEASADQVAKVFLSTKQTDEVWIPASLTTGLQDHGQVCVKQPTHSQCIQITTMSVTCSFYRVTTHTILIEVFFEDNKHSAPVPMTNFGT
jgi:hypothetical protein